jgi:hypothetical protein
MTFTRMRTAFRSAIRLSVCSIVLVSARAAMGEDPQDSAVARQLFAEARQLMAGGDYRQASTRLEESLRLLPGKGTEFNLADCYEHLGRTASAWALYLQVASEAKRDGELAREEAARGRAEAVAPLVPRLTLKVSEPATDIEVLRDGKRVEPGGWGVPLPVDPGPHSLAAHAAGRAAWSSSVTLAAGETFVVVVPRLDDLPQPVAIAPAPPDRAPPKEGPHSTPGRTAGLIVGGVGVAAIAVGSVLGLESIGEYSSANPYCNGANQCREPGYSSRQSAIRDGNIATVAIAAGAAAVVGGAVMWFALRPAAGRPTNGGVRASVVARESGVAVLLGGVW